MHVNMMVHFMYSILPMVNLFTLSVTLSTSCTRLCSNIGRKKLSTTQAAMCTPIDEYHISRIIPTEAPISISVQRGKCAGRLIRNRIYIIGKHQPTICMRLKSSTCSINTSSNFPICLIHPIVYGHWIVVYYSYGELAHIPTVYSL